MTPQEIQIAVAEEMGWIWHGDSSWTKMGEDHYWKLADACYLILPPYTTSIDAIREACLERFNTLNGQDTFQTKLLFKALGKMEFYWQLTALDWCEAFLETVKQLK